MSRRREGDLNSTASKVLYTAIHRSDDRCKLAVPTATATSRGAAAPASFIAPAIGRAGGPNG